MKRVVITGMGIVSPLGADVASTWAGLTAGRSGIRAIQRFDASQMACRIAGEVEDVVPEGMSQKDIGRRDRYAVLAIHAADQAFKQSGLDMEAENPERCGVAVGTGIGGLETLQENIIAFHDKGPRRVSPFAVPKCLVNMAAGEVAIRLGFQGPNKAIVTACATATQCIGEALTQIRLGKADVMLTGGSEAAVMPFGVAAFAALRAVSTRNDDPEHASRPFDRDRDGFVMGDGAGMLILESEEHAKARGAEILGEIAGHGETCDANHITAPREDGSGGIRAMRLALADAELAPEAIGYYNAHGTSTKLNDASECRAVRAAFGGKTPAISSTKSMIGHLLGAAGAAEAIACVMTLRDGVIHPSANIENLDPDCEADIVIGAPREAKVDAAMSYSAGFGGHNAALIVKRYA